MQKRNDVADFIRIIAVFSVVLLHTVSSPFKVWNDNWMQFNVTMSATRWCVPVLFMLSGALLLGKEESLRTFFFKRCSKIIIPLIFWSYIYIIFSRNFHYLDPAHANPNVYIQPWLIIKYPAYFHLWFLYAIIGVYIMMPLIRLIAKNRQITIYTLCLWFFWFSILPFMQSFGYLHGRVFFIFKLDIIPLWSGFALLGYFIKDNNDKFKAYYPISLASMGLIATIILTYIDSSDGIPKETYQSYFMPNIIILSCGLFSLLLKINRLPVDLCKASKYCFGTYLCHMIVMPLVWKVISNDAITKNGVLLALASSLITFSVSMTLVYMISKIKFIQRVI